MAMERVLEAEVIDTVAQAEAYDAMDMCSVNHAFARTFLELGAKGRVLDVGCGPGHLALQLVAISSKVEVVGVDLSQQMLAIAEEHRVVSSHADQVRFQLADAKALPFEDGSFDAVCCKSTLHHIPDPSRLLSEIWRLRADGGALLIRDLYRPEDEAGVEVLIEKYATERTESGKENMRSGLRAALTPDELLELARAAGMQGAELVIDSDRHMSLQVAATKVKD